jgi:hypothetical protein
MCSVALEPVLRGHLWSSLLSETPRHRVRILGHYLRRAGAHERVLSDRADPRTFGVWVFSKPTVRFLHSLQMCLSALSLITGFIAPVYISRYVLDQTKA